MLLFLHLDVLVKHAGFIPGFRARMDWGGTRTPMVIAALSGDAKSYAERMYQYMKVDSLDKGAADEALCKPAKSEDVDFTQDAMDKIFELTRGYPYFIQEFGKKCWDLAEETPITVEIVNEAIDDTLKELDDSFFKVRFDRATKSERRMMFAMASLGSGPYLMSDVADKVGVKPQSLSPTRATLISKGFLYTPGHGYIAFTVPLFDEFLNRVEQG